MNLTKLEPPNLDLQNTRYKNIKSAFKTAFLNYLSNTQSLTTGVHRSAGPACHRHRNRGGGFDGVATEELVDGDSSGDTKDTYVTYVMR